MKPKSNEYFMCHMDQQVKKYLPDYVVKAVEDTLYHVYSVGFVWYECLDEFIRRKDAK